MHIGESKCDQRCGYMFQRQWWPALGSPGERDVLEGVAPEMRDKVIHRQSILKGTTSRDIRQHAHFHPTDDLAARSWEFVLGPSGMMLLKGERRIAFCSNSSAVTGHNIVLHLAWEGHHSWHSLDFTWFAAFSFNVSCWKGAGFISSEKEHSWPAVGMPADLPRRANNKICCWPRLPPGKTCFKLLLNIIYLYKNCQTVEYLTWKLLLWNEAWMIPTDHFFSEQVLRTWGVGNPSSNIFHHERGCPLLFFAYSCPMPSPKGHTTSTSASLLGWAVLDWATSLA